MYRKRCILLQVVSITLFSFSSKLGSRSPRLCRRRGKADQKAAMSLLNIESRLRCAKEASSSTSWHVLKTGPLLPRPRPPPPRPEPPRLSALRRTNSFGLVDALDKEPPMVNLWSKRFGCGCFRSDGPSRPIRGLHTVCIALSPGARAPAKVRRGIMVL